MNHFIQKEVKIPAVNVIVEGSLLIPEDATSIVVFAHGSGSSRFSKRNQQVASYLHQHNIGTLLFDLLTPEEDRTYQNRFDIDLLAQRLQAVTEWLHQQEATKAFPVGYFGASTGAAAALKAAALTSFPVYAVVSRGGRPDLAMHELPMVEAPTLLIVGSLDVDVLALNQKALAELNCKKKLEIVEGATHLFEETGTLEQVEQLAAYWFKKHIPQMNIL